MDLIPIRLARRIKVQCVYLSAVYFPSPQAPALADQLPIASGSVWPAVGTQCRFLKYLRQHKLIIFPVKRVSCSELPTWIKDVTKPFIPSLKTGVISHKSHFDS